MNRNLKVKVQRQEAMSVVISQQMSSGFYFVGKGLKRVGTVYSNQHSDHGHGNTDALNRKTTTHANGKHF